MLKQVDGSFAKNKPLFFTVSNNGNISSKSLRIVSSGNNKEVSNVSDQHERIIDIVDWSIEVYDTSYGNKVCDVKNLTDSTYQLNTSGWKSGLYVIRVVVGDEVLSDKMVVGK